MQYEIWINATETLARLFWDLSTEEKVALEYAGYRRLAVFRPPNLLEDSESAHKWFQYYVTNYVGEPFSKEERLSWVGAYDD